jgi:hypothetical protein
MNLPEEYPPRLLGETAQYENDPFALGEIDDEALVVVQDFFPRLPASRHKPVDETCQSQE